MRLKEYNDITYCVRIAIIICKFAHLQLKVYSFVIKNTTSSYSTPRHSWVTRCIAKHTLYRNAWLAGALVLAVQTYIYACVGVCVHVHVYMCASPPSREHGAVERMRNVGVEEVREGGRGAVGGLELESGRGREGERGQRGRERGLHGRGMEYVEARLILISVHAILAKPPRKLRASRPTLELEVAASGVGGRGGREAAGESRRTTEEGGRGRLRERTRLTEDRGWRSEGVRWDSLTALSTGGGRGPRGWHSVTFNPRPASAAPHSNNRHRRFGGWMTE